MLTLGSLPEGDHRREVIVRWLQRELDRSNGTDESRTMAARIAIQAKYRDAAGTYLRTQMAEDLAE